MALSAWMTIKTAVLNSHLAEQKWCSCQPKELSTRELERLTRRFTSEISPINPPQIHFLT